MSSYEEHIIKVLKKSKIKFTREKSFSDCRNGKYRFDFYFTYGNNECCIEVDGEQHFHYIPHFHKNEIGFRKQREYDRRKNSYCLGHSIMLFRIPYWRVKDIETLSDILNPSNEFLVKTIWHNDLIKMPI